MARKSSITVTSRADAAKTANVALARRLASKNIHGGGNQAIPLKEKGRWHTYIANTYQNESEFHLMKERGWVPLVPEDLDCPLDQSGFRLSPDGYLVRGPQGQEMIFKMEETDYKALMAAKTNANMRGIGSKAKIKDDMANGAAAAYGSEAGDYVHSIGDGVIDHVTGGDVA